VQASRRSTSAITSNLRRRPLLALVMLILLLLIGYAARAVTTHHDSQQSPSRTASTASSHPSAQTPLSSLPPEAQQTVALVRAGGPFPYSHDGIVYDNLENQLPSEPRGFYHEYTVVTPGSDDRGARRIITGQGGQFYYTADHYGSFVAVEVGK
jgi:ribonuclease T1